MEASKANQVDFIINKAVDTFGTTINAKDAGYILPDGRMLNFYGKDHAEIATILPLPKDTKKYIAVNTFKDLGNIRVQAARGEFNLLVFDINKLPTSDQMDTMEDLLFDSDTEDMPVSIDVPGHNYEFDTHESALDFLKDRLSLYVKI